MEAVGPSRPIARNCTLFHSWNFRLLVVSRCDRFYWRASICRNFALLPVCLTHSSDSQTETPLSKSVVLRVWPTWLSERKPKPILVYYFVPFCCCSVSEMCAFLPLIVCDCIFEWESFYCLLVACKSIVAAGHGIKSTECVMILLVKIHQSYTLCSTVRWQSSVQDARHVITAIHATDGKCTQITSWSRENAVRESPAIDDRYNIRRFIFQLTAWSDPWVKNTLFQHIASKSHKRLHLY